MCGSHFVSLGGTVIFQVLFVKWFGQPRVLAIFTLFFSIPLSVMTSQVLFVKRFGQSEFGYYYCLSHFISPATLQPGLLAFGWMDLISLMEQEYWIMILARLIRIQIIKNEYLNFYFLSIKWPQIIMRN